MDPKPPSANTSVAERERDATREPGMNMAGSFELVPWSVRIEGLQTRLRVGIYAHEERAQRVAVDVKLEGRGPAVPAGLADCINYEPVVRFITVEWPQASHVQLLETRILELMRFVFEHDPKITRAEVALYKLDLDPLAHRIGVQLAMDRDQYARLLAPASGRRADRE